MSYMYTRVTKSNIFYLNLIEMSKLTLYNPSLSRVDILKEREELFLYSSVKEKFDRLFNLIHLSVKLNGAKPLKVPQSKGILISKPIL